MTDDPLICIETTADLLDLTTIFERLFDGFYNHPYTYAGGRLVPVPGRTTRTGRQRRRRLECFDLDSDTPEAVIKELQTRIEAQGHTVWVTGMRWETSAIGLPISAHVPRKARE